MTDRFIVKMQYAFEKNAVKRLSFLLAFILLLQTNLYADVSQIKTEQISFRASIDGKEYLLEAMLYAPLDGKQQHPLIIMTHGRHGPLPDRNKNQVFGYQKLNKALASKGFLVMMLVRRGYGNSDGPDSEFLYTAEESGLAGAQDIKAAIDYMRAKPEVLQDRIVIIGQSQGGWVAIASSTLDNKGVLGAINISGATNFRKRMHKSVRSAEVEDQLKNAAKLYGKSSNMPMLWIYAENDHYRPDAVKQWFNAYKEAGGKGKLMMKPPYKNDGHTIVSEPDLFMEDILDFFKEIGFTSSEVKLPSKLYELRETISWTIYSPKVFKQTADISGISWLFIG